MLADLGRDSTKACIAMLGKWLNGAVGTGYKQREWSTVLEAVGEAIGTEVQRFISDNLGTLKLYISNLLFLLSICVICYILTARSASYNDISARYRVGVCSRSVQFSYEK